MLFVFPSIIYTYSYDLFFVITIEEKKILKKILIVYLSKYSLSD